jgi:hypothetical protein
MEMVIGSVIKIVTISIYIWSMNHKNFPLRNKQMHQISSIFILINTRVNQWMNYYGNMQYKKIFVNQTRNRQVQE